MVAPRLLSSLFGALLTFYTAAAVGLTPGSIGLGLVFPLNDTYAPQDGPLSIVFTLSSHPFQPALASSLELRLTYLLLETHYGRVAYGDFDLGKLASSSVDNPYFVIGYSNKLAGRESQFELKCTITSIVGFTSTDNSSTEDNRQGTLAFGLNIIYNSYFTTQSGAKAAEVPSTASNGSTCLAHGGWMMEFDVSDYLEFKSHNYAVMAPDSPTIGPVPCAVEVDGAIAKSITAGMATATAMTTKTTASSSSSGAAASTAGTLSSSGIVAAVWSLLVLGLSVVLFIC